MRPPVLAVRGTSVFAGNRPGRLGLSWGNDNITKVDPSAPTILWTDQEYPASDVAVPIHHLLGCVQATMNGPALRNAAANSG